MRHIKTYQIFESQQELTLEQKDWLDKCTKGTWEINPQTGLVDIYGKFDCSHQSLTDFKGVRFGKVSGYFGCNNNPLTSLEGAPQSVGVDFNCTNNSLTSLEGAPKHVGRDFYCGYNSLTSLKGAPQHVDGGFSCSNNYKSLTSLEGAPQRVGGNFSCSYNSLTSLEGAPKHVGGSFYCYYNSLTSLEGAPQHVGGNFDCSDNPISGWAIKEVLKRMRDKKIPLEGAVEELWEELSQDDRVYLAKHHPDLSPEEKRGYAALERLKTRVI